MSPLSADRAWGVVSAWLDTEPAWIPHPSRRTLQIFSDLVKRLHVTANLIPDAMLASVAIEHGLAVCTADSDFTRFPVRVVNPVATQANRR